MFGSFRFDCYTATRHGNAYGIFVCEICGESRERVVSQVRTGYIRSCNCQRKNNATKHGHASNGIGTPEYNAWSSMKKRCLNPSHASYKHYGGRGITVCERWMIFDNFLSDMGERKKGLSLDRIDNSRGYSPENCRWVDAKTQCNNKRTTTILTLRGKSMTISQWSAETGIKDCTISERIRRGWSVEKTLTTPPGKYSYRNAADNSE